MLSKGELPAPRFARRSTMNVLVFKESSGRQRLVLEETILRMIRQTHPETTWTKKLFFFDEAIQKIYYCHIQDEADDCAICQFKENIILKTQWKTKTTFDNFSILNDSETSNERVEKQFLKKLHTLTGVGRGIRRSRGKYKFWFHKCAICLMFTVYGRSLPMWFNLKKKHAIVESWLHSAINILKYVSFII